MLEKEQERPSQQEFNLYCSKSQKHYFLYNAMQKLKALQEKKKQQEQAAENPANNTTTPTPTTEGGNDSKQESLMSLKKTGAKKNNQKNLWSRVESSKR